MALFLVELRNGPVWVPSLARREQPGFAAHAAFIDSLVEAGRLLLGGPVGEGEGDGALLLIESESAAEVAALLAPDPWLGSVLIVGSIRRWTLWVGNMPVS